MKTLHHVPALLLLAIPAAAQLLGPTPIPPRQDNSARTKNRERPIDPEWLWQYSPPPENGREHELIQDPEFLPFLAQNLTAPQSFWQAPTGERKRLPEVAYDFLAIPGSVLSDGNRYITVTGSVFRRRTDRGLLFVDLNIPSKREPLPYVVFAAIDWDREGKTTEEPDAPYTLWLFPNRPGTTLTDAATHSIVRWMKQPIPGTGQVEHITHAIQVDPDGTPHQIPVPVDPTADDNTPTLAPRHSP